MLAIVHTYGHIDSMFYVLNGIAALTTNKTIMPVIQTMCLLVASYYGIKMAYSGNSNQNKEYLLKTLGMLLIINVAIIPKTSMIIRDSVTKKQEKVDGIPYGFVVPVAILEHFGDTLTVGFEQAFQAVGVTSTSYRDYGMVFGARLIQEARSWRIKNPEALENMDNFIKRCIIREAMIGKSYTPNDLLLPISGDLQSAMQVV
jgi:conjugal transfer mating pair stabilization protein TraG